MSGEASPQAWEGAGSVTETAASSMAISTYGDSLQTEQPSIFDQESTKGLLLA